MSHNYRIIGQTPILLVHIASIVDNPWVIVDDGQATGKLYHLWLRVECTFFFTHLAFRPCELLPSLFVCRPFVNISHFNLLLRNHWANCNQTLMEWSLGGSLPNLCPVIQTSNQDDHQVKNRKRGDEI